MQRNVEEIAKNITEAMFRTDQDADDMLRNHEAANFVEESIHIVLQKRRLKNLARTRKLGKGACDFTAILQKNFTELDEEGTTTPQLLAKIIGEEVRKHIPKNEEKVAGEMAVATKY